MVEQLGYLHPGPLQGGALPKKSVLRLICYRFHALNISILLSILSFGQSPEGEKGKRVHSEISRAGRAAI